MGEKTQVHNIAAIILAQKDIHAKVTEAKSDIVKMNLLPPYNTFHVILLSFYGKSFFRVGSLYRNSLW